MYRDRLNELRGGNNQGYNQINDRQYDDYYGRSNGHGGGNSNYGGRSGNSNNYGGAYSRGNGYSSPPERGGDVASQYSGRISNINNDIKSIWNYVDRLESLYNRSFNEVRRAETAENARRISELEERVTAEIQKLTNQIKGIKSEVERISNPRDKKMVLSQVNNATNNLKKVFESYNDKRKRYVDQGRSKQIRQYQIVHKGASLEEAERYVDSHPGQALQYSMLSGSKAAFDEATQRRDQMEQINQSINELCDLFQDMNNMLVAQNETINIIEENLDTAEYNVEEASKELTKAIEIRKSSRKKLWIITLIVLAILSVFILWLLTWLGQIGGIFAKIFGINKDTDTQQQQQQQPMDQTGQQQTWG